MNKFALAIHGGAGTIIKEQMLPEMEKEYREGLLTAITSGSAILEKGGTALDAVEAAIQSLEDHPLFNAGKGSVFTHDAKHEMDAAIMTGHDLKAGAVAGIQHVKNPIRLAKAVMEHSDNVLLAGEGAIAFAAKMHLPFETDDYFYTKQRMDQLLEIQDTGKMKMDHSNPGETGLHEKKFGTVGAVALDIFGNLAAGTSTGGMTNKRYGRIGDTPIIGSGTYANNNTCAISCTGHGEYFIRAVVAYDISCLMEYKGLSLEHACHEVVHKKLINLGGEGGLIAVDAWGNIQMPFNSEGMYRAMKQEHGDFVVEIYK